MRTIRNFWQQIFDIRPGEYLRTLYMFFYLLWVLFAYYVLKAASEAMFLNKFDIDKLPHLYILMAIFGGILAYLYSKLAVRTSLKVAVFWTMFLSVACLLVMWWVLRRRDPIMIWTFAVWVRLFSVIVVAQGWLVASNLFNTREAKRVYGLLGMGMVIGAAFGGEFTNRTVHFVGTDNLLLASAVLVILAYISFLLAVTRKGVSLEGARAAEGEEADFSFRDVARDVGRSRHLQTLIGIMVMQFVIDTLIDFQFKAMAKASFHGDALTAFFGRFYGRYLNLTEFVLQLFCTTAVLRRFGVGGTLQIMPVTLGLASLTTVAAPSVLSTSFVRLTEASTRYTLTRTGIELLYLPLPREMRNRIKAFVDIFVDRMARGLSGAMLILFTSLALTVREIALIVIGITIPWIWLTARAHKEYVATIRKRLESRRLDLAGARISVEGGETIRMLEQVAAGPHARQAAYALSLLSETRRFDPRPLLHNLEKSPFAEVRAQAYELTRARHLTDLVDRAREEIRALDGAAAVPQAVAYLLAVSTERGALARELLEHPDPRVAESAVEALRSSPEDAAELIGDAWLAQAAVHPDPRRRAVAALAVAVRGDQGTEVLHRLLEDRDPAVLVAACRAAGILRNRAYVFAITRHLANPRLRGAAIQALAQYGPPICGTLGDMLEDEQLPLAIRLQIPRVIKTIPHQRSVDVLLTAIGHHQLSIRAAALMGLNRLRETAPGLKFDGPFLTQRILGEAHYYFELNAVLEPFRRNQGNPQTATSLLARTIEGRLQQTLERLFRLLGLRYPPKEIYSTWLAVSRRRSEEHATALEFLDSVLERELKRVVLPLLESSDRLLERGRDLFGVEIRDTETAIRELMHSGDPWLVVCAMTAAAELRLRGLAPEIARAAERGEPDILEVARAAQSVLA